jgi:hypothetical protein
MDTFRCGATTMTEDDFIIKLRIFYSKHRAIIMHDFDNLFSISKIIDSSNTLNKDEKYFYFKILSDQLYYYELPLLYYYLEIMKSSSDPMKPEFKDLADKYNLLKNLDKLLLMKITIISK